MIHVGCHSMPAAKFKDWVEGRLWDVQAVVTLWTKGPMPCEGESRG